MLKRNELIAATGMSRSTILQRVGVLLASGLIREGGSSRSRRGRPPAALSFNERGASPEGVEQMVAERTGATAA